MKQYEPKRPRTSIVTLRKSHREGHEGHKGKKFLAFLACFVVPFHSWVCFSIIIILCVLAAPAGANRQNNGGGYFSAPTVKASYIPLAESWMYQGEQQGAEFGLATASAGDVNGDGYDDVIIGAPRYDAGVYREGAAFVFHGSPGGLGATTYWLAGSGQTGSRFGSAVASAGDVNGDGFDDVVVGAYAYNDGQTKVGAVFVFYGSPGGLGITAGTLLLGEETDAEFGYSASSAGDVNGDGFADVVVGARYADGVQANEGAAYLFYGSSSGLEQIPAWTVSGGQNAAGFGSAVASVGDVNGDNYDDIVVGAPYFDHILADEGAAFVFSGSPSGLSPTPVWQAQGGQEGAGFGSAVASAGDVNGDSFSDLVVGAPHYSANRPDEGAALLFNGSAAGLAPTPSRLIPGGQEGAGFGTSAATAGDVNGDTYDDVVVGAYLYSGDQSHEGAIFLYCGSGTGLSSWPSWSAGGDKADTGFGYTVGTAGDVNGDSFGDVVAGAPQYRLSQIIVGRVFGYHGLPGADGASTFLPIILNQNP